MANKKYTLYFKANKYGHKYELPIVSLSLRKMDIYTSNYKDYNDLFESLPIEMKNYIKDNLCNDVNGKLENNFFITDDDFNPIMGMWWRLLQFLGQISFTSNLEVIKESELLDQILAMYPIEYRPNLEEAFSFAKTHLLEGRGTDIYAKNPFKK